MMTRRAALIAAAAAAMLAGCSSVDSGVATVQRRYAAQSGVASITLTAFVPNESIILKGYKGEVTFTADSTPSRQGTLIVLLFQYMRDAGLDPLMMHGITFHTAQDAHVSLTTSLDDEGMATEVATVMAATPNADLAIDASPGTSLPVLTVTWTVSHEEAMDLVHSVTRISAVPTLSSFTVRVGITDFGVPYMFTVQADRRITTQELAFAAVLQGWLGTHGVVGLILPFSDRTEAMITIETLEDQSTDIQSIMLWARSAGIKARVDAYLNKTNTRYLSIPRP